MRARMIKCPRFTITKGETPGRTHSAIRFTESERDRLAVSRIVPT